MSVVINPGVEADPRLLNTGPSPFGWHRYETALRCLAAYGYGVEARKLGLRHDAPQLARGTLVHLGLATEGTASAGAAAAGGAAEALGAAAAGAATERQGK